MEHQDPAHDQQRNDGSLVGESTSMTIEFLRARLHAERSVSRTARQRADELAKRVLELEEQLKIVSLQRKRAEKATADVLAILEDRGVSDFSEEFDSNSDQETSHFEPKVENNFPDEEHLVGSNMERNRSDEFSGSEIETSLSGRSLSWKSGKDSPISGGKKVFNSSSKKQNPFSSPSFASSRRSTGGKSCRRIRQRETRTTVEEHTNGSMQAPQENGDAASAEGCPTSSSSATEIPVNSSERGNLNNGVEGSGDLEGSPSEAPLSNHLSVHNSDREMERALEHQAQLIGQYEEEEEAQREWEEKFRENNSSLVSYEPGNTRSGMTKERDETKADLAPYHVRSNGSRDFEAKSNVENVLITKQSSSTSKLSGQQPSLPSHPNVRYFQDEEKSSSSFSKGKSISGSKTKSHGLVPHEGPDKLASVLKALQQAKLSLNQQALQQAKVSLNHKLKASPQLDGGSLRKAIEVPAKDRPEVPIGCAALFKVPSDVYVEHTRQNNLFASSSRMSLTNYHPVERNTLNSADRLITGHSSEICPRFPSIESHLTTSMDAGFSHPYSFTRSDLNINGDVRAVLGASEPFPSLFLYNGQTMDINNVHSSYASPTHPLYTEPRLRMPYGGEQPLLSTDVTPVHLRTPNGLGQPLSSTDMNQFPSSDVSLTYPQYTDPMIRNPSGGEQLYSGTESEVSRADLSFYNHVPYRPNMYRH